MSLPVRGHVCISQASTSRVCSAGTSRTAHPLSLRWQRLKINSCNLQNEFCYHKHIADNMEPYYTESLNINIQNGYILLPRVRLQLNTKSTILTRRTNTTSFSLHILQQAKGQTKKEPVKKMFWVTKLKGNRKLCQWALGFVLMGSKMPLFLTTIQRVHIQFSF